MSEGAPWYDPSKGDKAGINAEIAAGGTVYDNGSSGSAKTLSVVNGSRQKLLLTASAPSITVGGFVTGRYGEITLYLTQDGTGSRLLPTFVPAADYGTTGAPTLSTVAGKVDILKLSSIDGGTTLDVVMYEKGA